jgi:glycosyltransferase involved in cell wall biosynthesis
MTATDKPPLGIVTPLPPFASGVADYALAQGRALAARWNVTFLLADDQPDPSRWLPPGLRLERWSRWAARHGRGSMKLLHHIGNNPQHFYVLDALASHGGVALMHEIGLHNLMAYRTLGQGDTAGYERLLRAEIGEGAAPLIAASLSGLRSALHDSLTPLFAPVVAAADGVVVHSPSAARELALRGCGKPIAVVPHFFAPPADAERAGNTARAGYGLGAETIVFGSLGFMTDAKLTFLVIATLGRLSEKLPPFHYLLVGEAGDRTAIDRALARARIAAQTTITGYLDADDFAAHLAACDIVFALRYPSGGETSGTLVRALGHGKTVIAFDYGPFADFPDEALLKVPLDTFDTARLEAAILTAAGDPATRASRSAAALADTARHRDPAACAQCLSDFIVRIAAEAR